MGRITVTEFVTADGIMADPNLWSFPYWNDTIAAFKAEELLAADAQLLGRVTYEGFAAAWPERAGTNEFADKMNTMPKYVVSSTLKSAAWNNTTVLSSIEDVAKLKTDDVSILVAGSGTLIQSLIAADLVDDYRLLTYPLVRGEGKRLFEPGTTTHFELIEVRDMGSGVIAQRYRTCEAPAPVEFPAS